MKKVYNIGKFQFDSYEEYKKGLEDVKKIKYISKELDINEPGVALRLYTLIRQQNISFQSVIGEDYLLYLSDLVADEYKELSVTQAANTESSGRRNASRKIAGIICIILAILCFAYFLGSEYISIKKAREAQELQDSKDVSRAASYIAKVINESLKTVEEAHGTKKEEEPQTSETKEEKTQTLETKEEEPEILPEYVDLYEKNSHMVGWIRIPDTEIDYPVMQSPNSNEYYLRRNFEKKDDINGCIFMDMRNNYIDRDDNLIIYGHNMNDGQMFGSLEKYLETDYLKSHETIEFDTLYEREKYVIIAVCLAKVEYRGNDAFRYYNFFNAEDEAAFEEYRKNIEKLNVSEGEVDLQYGDKLITLSTCNNYIEDGRLFLVAKKIN